jgi:hypothetical protein
MFLSKLQTQSLPERVTDQLNAEIHGLFKGQVLLKIKISKDVSMVFMVIETTTITTITKTLYTTTKIKTKHHFPSFEYSHQTILQNLPFQKHFSFITKVDVSLLFFGKT